MNLLTKTVLEPAMAVDGPFAVEEDDLEDWALSTVLPPKWLWQISVPTGAQRQAIKIARALGSFLADKGNGAAYDPQEDRVFFPWWPKRHKINRPPDRKTNQISLEFVLPYSAVTDATSKELISFLRQHCPEAIPNRFGDFEPLQRRMDQGVEAPFIDYWKEAMTVEYGALLFWKSNPPCLGGSFSFSDTRNTPPNLPDVYARKHELAISFDGVAIETDDEYRERIVNLFRTLAASLRAFYAACYVRRQVIIRRGSVFFDLKETETGLNICHGPWWRGLPTCQSWLNWFEPGYMELVAPKLEGSRYIQEKTQQGLFLRMGKQVMNADQLKDIYPILPESLIILENGHAALIPKTDKSIVFTSSP